MIDNVQIAALLRRSMEDAGYTHFYKEKLLHVLTGGGHDTMTKFHNEILNGVEFISTHGAIPMDPIPFVETYDYVVVRYKTIIGTHS